MIVSSYDVGCVWKNRGESIRDLGDGALRTLDAIREICPFCETWQVADRSAGAMVSLERHRSSMAALAMQGVSRNEFGEAEPDYGYRIQASNNPIAREREISMTFRGAQKSPAQTGGSAEWHTNTFVPAAPEIVAYPVIRSILRVMISVWRPAYADADCMDLRELRHQSGGPLDIAWMRYLSAPLAAQISIPSCIRVEYDSDGGVLLIAADETFDVMNTNHMAAAREIQGILETVNHKLSCP